MKLRSIKNTIYKKSFNKVALIILVILMVLCLGVYGYLTYLTNLQESGVMVVKSASDLAAIKTWKDVLIVVTSTLSVNLFVSLLLTNSNSNKLLTKFFADGVIASPDFYKRISKNERAQMLKSLELSEYYNNNQTLQTVHHNIGKKLSAHQNDDYYYEKCEYIVETTEMDNYFENVVIRNISLRSYVPTKTIHNFRLATVDNHEGMSSYYEVLELNVEGHKRDTSNVIPKPGKCEDELNSQNGYTDVTHYYLKGGLTLTNDKNTDIYVKVKTRSPKNDPSLAFRASVPCRRLSVDYIIKNTTKYKVVARAFGVMEPAVPYPNNYGDNGTKIELKDWVLKDNGIVIHIINK